VSDITAFALLATICRKLQMGKLHTWLGHGRERNACNLFVGIARRNGPLITRMQLGI
jgi:hypothetical protein